MLHMLINYYNFNNKKIQLQYIIQENVGGFLCKTPKYHFYIVGVGIEYLWGCVGLRY